MAETTEVQEEFVEKTEVTGQEVVADLDGQPRPGEEFVLTIKGKKRKLVPATLRNIPKVGEIVASFTSADQDDPDVNFFSQEKTNQIAQLIHLSLSKEDQEEVAIDDVLDECNFSDFPMALQAVLALNDFLERMGQVRVMMDGMV